MLSFVPHTLAEIEGAGKGDCKDMATSSVALMRKLGFDAHVAIIERGYNPVISPFSNSVADHFNHAIVYVKTKSKAYWLDPTNQQSYLGINPDIMDRPAVVLIPDGKTFEAQTTMPEASGDLFQASEVVTPTTGLGVNVVSKVKLTGNIAVPFTTARIGTVKSQSDSVVLSLVGRPFASKECESCSLHASRAGSS